MSDRKASQTDVPDKDFYRCDSEPVAWQWRYVGETEWKTPSGGKKLTPEQLKNERPIEQRPLYAADTPQTRGLSCACGNPLMCVRCGWQSTPETQDLDEWCRRHGYTD